MQPSPSRRPRSGRFAKRGDRDQRIAKITAVLAERSFDEIDDLASKS
jgi:hypothetical protein